LVDSFFDIVERLLILRRKYIIPASLNLLLKLAFGRLVIEIASFSSKGIDLLITSLEESNIEKWKIIFAKILLVTFFGGNIYTLLLFLLIFLIVAVLKALEIIYNKRESKHASKQVFKKPVRYIERKIIKIGYKHTDNSNYINESMPLLSMVSSINDENKVALLGEAGSGKSTELENIAWALSTANKELFPFLIKLSEYVNQDIPSRLPPNWEAIEKNKFILILDGLDEIESKNRNDARRHLAKFTEDFPEIRVIISSRRNFYNIESKDSSGTIQGFTSYLILDLTDNDITEFLTRELGQNIIVFLDSINNSGIYELLKNPFYLIHLVELFSTNNTLPSTRSEIFENLLEARFSFDTKHYRHSYDLKEIKVSIIQSLEKISLAMELLGRNYITEEEFQKLIPLKEDREIIKACTAYTKKVEGKWQFEHNNFNEYLASRALQNQSLTTIKIFIAFQTPTERVKISWINTLSFLIDKLSPEDQLSKELIDFILTHDPKIVLNFEGDKISIRRRSEIFKKVFEHYKKKDIWINTSKYTESKLAKFAESQETIDFLLNEIQLNNSRITKLNAIHLLGYFNFENLNPVEVQKILLSLLDDTQYDNNFKHSVISALTNSKLNNESVIKTIIEKLGANEDQYIRSSLYYTLLRSNILDDNIEIFIEGYKIYKNRKRDKNTAPLMNEFTNLKEGFKKVRSPLAIKKVILFIIENDNFELEIGVDSIWESLVKNGIEAFHNDPSIYDDFFNLLLNFERTYKIDLINNLLNFFYKTETQERVYDTLLSVSAEKRSGMLFAKVCNVELLKKIIIKFNTKNISDQDLKSIIWDIRRYNYELYPEFEKLILSLTNYKLEPAIILDFNKIQIIKNQNNFDLLFNPLVFKERVEQVFKELGKEELSSDEIYDLGKDDHTNPFPKHPEIVLEYLREHTNQRTVTKKEIDNILIDDAKLKEVLIDKIYHELNNDHHHLIVSSDQEKFIHSWVKDNIQIFDFTKAYFQTNGSPFVKNKAILLWFFYRKFHFEYSEEILLDMLSFDWTEKNNMQGIAYLENILDENKIKERIKKNLEEGIQDEGVLKNHIEYALRKNIIETYNLIEKEIENKDRSELNRSEIFDLYFDKTHDIKIIPFLPKIESTYLKWHIINKISTFNPLLLKDYLNGLLSEEQNIETRLNAAEYLIEINDINALDFFITWIIDNKQLPNGRSISRRLDRLISIDALPYLMRLLKFYYEQDSQDPFDRIDAFVLDALYRIGLTSENNFIEVKKTMEEFIRENSERFENVRFLFLTLERLEDEFYLTKSENLNIDNVIERLKILSN
jgi:hypothetical protein